MERGRSRLLYLTFPPAPSHVYVIRDGHAEKLVGSSGLDYDATLSPDGEWVVFTSERHGAPSLFVARPASSPSDSSPRLLVDGEGMQDQAVVSPDGASMVFASTHEGSTRLYRIAFEPTLTTPVARATCLTPGGAGHFRPSFSPDGSMLAFSSDLARPPRIFDNTSPGPFLRQRGGDVYVMAADGGDHTRLTSTPDGWAGSPSWSAAGDRVFFYRRQLVPPRDGEGARRRPHYRYGLWSAAAGGGDERLLVDSFPAPPAPPAAPSAPSAPSAAPATSALPALLSPAAANDGRVLFAAGSAFGATAPAFRIWSVREDGGDLRPITDEALSLSSPSAARDRDVIVAHGSDGTCDVPLTGSAIALAGGPCVVEPTGTTLRIGDEPVDVLALREFAAVPTPDGRIVRCRQPGPDLEVMAADGRGAVTITKVDDRDIPVNGMVVSPDGEWVVFMRGDLMAAANHRCELWKVRLDGTGLTCLTPDNDDNNGWPSFASDGSWIAFQSARGGTFDLYRMRPDGSEVLRLTDDGAANKTPSVSPTGRHIAFASDRDNAEARLFDIYVLELDDDGGPIGTTRLTANGVQNGHPSFSPDGEWVLYTSEAGGLCDEEPQAQAVTFAVQMYGDIYAHHLATGTVVRLTHNKWENGNPVWSRTDTNES